MRAHAYSDTSFFILFFSRSPCCLSSVRTVRTRLRENLPHAVGGKRGTTPHVFTEESLAPRTRTQVRARLGRTPLRAHLLHHARSARWCAATHVLREVPLAPPKGKGKSHPFDPPFPPPFSKLSVLRHSFSTARPVKDCQEKFSDDAACSSSSAS